MSLTVIQLAVRILKLSFSVYCLLQSPLNVAADEAGQPPLVIPASAPLITGRRAVVYVEKPQSEHPTFEGREVVLGPRAGDYYIVKSGLAEGQRVVTKGNFKIDSALQIQAKPSMMNPGGQTTSMDHQHGTMNDQ